MVRPSWLSLSLLSVALTGCHGVANDVAYTRVETTAPTGRSQASASLAHGGSAVPNGRAYDATFFKDHGTNPFVDTDDDRQSTFALDVDTASYTVARSYLEKGSLPPPESVRVEEFVNRFHYGYPAPRDEDFAIHLEGARSHWGANRCLLRVGLQARTVKPSRRQDAILTFVVDVSGSMAREDRLELVKKSLRVLVDQLGEGDRIGIVTYGNSADVRLRHVGAEERDEILDVLDDLEAGGSTNAEDGLRAGYKLASKAYRPDAINRVILCTDGVANVGRTGPDEILAEIQRYVKNGITLSALGFGMENFNDVLLERLGDRGNGHYAYVDSLDEARQLFGRDLTATLQLVARDARIQVDFDPSTVRSYRLLGYENRDMADDRFRDKRADGGEVGAGHDVTALYEVKLWDGEEGRRRGGRVATVRLRWKDADGERWHETSEEVHEAELERDFDGASPAFQLAVAAAEFAEILRGSSWARDRSLDWVLEVARGVRGDVGERGEVAELIDLVERARRLRRDGRDVADD